MYEAGASKCEGRLVLNCISILENNLVQNLQVIGMKLWGSYSERHWKYEKMKSYSHFFETFGQDENGSIIFGSRWKIGMDPMLIIKKDKKKAEKVHAVF